MRQDAKGSPRRGADKSPKRGFGNTLNAERYPTPNQVCLRPLAPTPTASQSAELVVLLKGVPVLPTKECQCMSGIPPRLDLETRPGTP